MPSFRSLLAAASSLLSLESGLILNFLDANDHRLRRAHFDDLTSGKCFRMYLTRLFPSQISSSLLELIKSPFFFSLNLYFFGNPETRARSSTSLLLSSNTTPSSSRSSLFGRSSFTFDLILFDMVGFGNGFVLNSYPAL